LSACQTSQSLLDTDAFAYTIPNAIAAASQPTSETPASRSQSPISSSSRGSIRYLETMEGVSVRDLALTGIARRSALVQRLAPQFIFFKSAINFLPYLHLRLRSEGEADMKAV
jgi:hypothetical protein